MKAFDEYRDKPASFWAFVKYVSENLGYSKRGSDSVKTYSFQEIRKLCQRDDINVSHELVGEVIDYCTKRANLLNNIVESHLMDAPEAQQHFRELAQLHRMEQYACKLPMNKQKGEMRQIAYFTAMINILAEKTIREHKIPVTSPGFDDDPRRLTYILDENQNVVGASSRRFDGAYPSIINPKAIWEIKEYYYAKTFGSRVADGVYETQLDGHEFLEILDRTGQKVYHILFIDSHYTWWVKGKSYLCRIIDSLNAGTVDEVIVGSEIFERWPQLLHEIIQ